MQVDAGSDFDEFDPLLVNLKYRPLGNVMNALAPAAGLIRAETDLIDPWDELWNRSLGNDL